LFNISFKLFFSENRIVGNLSASDLRGMNCQSIDNLVLPVLDFLASLPDSKNVLAPIAASPESTLRQALKDIVDHHIHRIWIVDVDGKVLDVTTLSDIIGLFAKI